MEEFDRIVTVNEQKQLWHVCDFVTTSVCAFIHQFFSSDLTLGKVVNSFFPNNSYNNFFFPLFFLQSY